MLNGTAPDDLTMVCAAKLGYRSKGRESIGSEQRTIVINEDENG